MNENYFDDCITTSEVLSKLYMECRALDREPFLLAARRLKSLEKTEVSKLRNSILVCIEQARPNHSPQKILTLLENVLSAEELEHNQTVKSGRK